MCCPLAPLLFVEGRRTFCRVRPEREGVDGETESPGDRPRGENDIIAEETRLRSLPERGRTWRNKVWEPIGPTLTDWAPDFP